MVASLSLALLALRSGLGMRRRRMQGLRGSGELRSRHLRTAKLAVSGIALGFVGGPLSAWLLRGWTPLGTLHGWVGCAALALFAATALRGRALERGRAQGAARDGHARLALLASLAAAVAAITGFVLLP